MGVLETLQRGVQDLDRLGCLRRHLAHLGPVVLDRRAADEAPEPAGEVLAGVAHRQIPPRAVDRRVDLGVGADDAGVGHQPRAIRLAVAGDHLGIEVGERGVGRRVQGAIERRRLRADRKAAQVRVAEWLAGIARSSPGKALKRLLDASPKVEALLTGLADGSPYLWDLASAEPERLLALLNADPDAHLAILLAKTAKAVAATKSEAEAMRLLRRMKAEAARDE